MGSGCDMKNRIQQGHPCFGGNRHENGRMHLAVAPACNIKCGYCTRKHDCVNESRPGVTSQLMTPQEAIARVREVKASPVLGEMVKVVGIAGPGDPLANRQTFETFELQWPVAAGVHRPPGGSGTAQPDRHHQCGQP